MQNSTKPQVEQKAIQKDEHFYDKRITLEVFAQPTILKQVAPSLYNSYYGDYAKNLRSLFN